MESWGSDNSENHLECMIGLIASSIQQGCSKLYVEEADTGLQITIVGEKITMTINQNGKFEVFE